MIWPPQELRFDGPGTVIFGGIMAFGRSPGAITFWEMNG
jgi:hypothetical protein